MNVATRAQWVRDRALRRAVRRQAVLSIVRSGLTRAVGSRRPS